MEDNPSEYSTTYRITTWVSRRVAVGLGKLAPWPLGIVVDYCKCSNLHYHDGHYGALYEFGLVPKVLEPVLAP